jgi:hypothetical protein
MAAPASGPLITGLLTTAEAIELIEAAGAPADLFGRDAARRYRRLARLTHPDARPGDARSAAAFAKLADLWQRHSQISAPAARPGDLLARGDLANLFKVSNGLLKLARNPADNDLMDREAAAMRTFASFMTLLERLYGPRKFRPFVIPA